MSYCKTCSRCGQQVDSQARFCPQCGGSDFTNAAESFNQQAFAPDEQVTTPYPQQGYAQDDQVTTPYPQQGYTPVSYPPQYANGAYPQPPKKKGLQWWHILLIVLGALLAVILLIVVIASLGGSKTDSGSALPNNGNSAVVADDDYDVSVPYTKGSLNGNVYTNEWADIRFVIPDGFSDAGYEYYEATENESTDCGLYLMADDYSSFMFISYEKLPSFPIYDEDGYLDIAMKGFEVQESITYQIVDSYTTVDIAGHAYRKATCFANNGYVDFAQGVYVRKIDNYMVCIIVVGESDAMNDAIVNTFTPAE